MLRPSLLDHFSALDDPRQRGKGLSPVPEIMLSPIVLVILKLVATLRRSALSSIVRRVVEK